MLSFSPCPVTDCKHHRILKFRTGMGPTEEYSTVYDVTELLLNCIQCKFFNRDLNNCIKEEEKPSGTKS